MFLCVAKYFSLKLYLFVLGGTGSANNLRQNLSLKLTQNYYQNCKVDNTMDQSPITENVISSQSKISE